MKYFYCLIILFSTTIGLEAQKDFYKDYTFTAADTLRGMLRPERTAYDVSFYELHITIDPDRKWLAGHVDIHYEAKADFTRLQIDLYRNMAIQKIEFDGQSLDYDRQFDAVFVDFPMQQKGSRGKFRVYYDGHPTEAKDPPWKGGFVWEKDRIGNYWIGVACEGDGASLWWPNKDHLSDEPDSMSISVAVPRNLFCAANGNFRSMEDVL